MREAQALKAQVDDACQKEAVIKECIHPQFDEAFAVTTNIEGKLAHMQVVYELRQVRETDNDASEAHAQQVQQMEQEFFAKVIEVQKLSDDLCMKITTLVK